jgi:hypothetical protein
LNKDFKSKLSAISKVEGWFDFDDALAFHSILKLQQEMKIHGDILEIGAFAGKSAIFLNYYRDKSEELHICDIFEGEISGSNKVEVVNSYSNLSVERFIRNFKSVFQELPIIHSCNSLELENRIGALEFRFIHIDGSHLFELVRSDLQFAVTHLDSLYGVIVLDDYRAPHTLGVACAMWQMIFTGRLRPILFTENKAYLSSISNQIHIQELRDKLDDFPIKLEEVQFMNFTVLRVIPSIGRVNSKSSSLIRNIIPPIIYQGLARSTKLTRAWSRLKQRN